ncbi:MAG: PP2C family protein-serine/threonine phosphatase [Acidimicrobiales bacterium]
MVLTGAHDRRRGLLALASGAQDYLVKGEVDGAHLARSIRYAVERTRAEAAGRALLLAERRQAENERPAAASCPGSTCTAPGCAPPPATSPAATRPCSAVTSSTPCNGPTARSAVIGDVCGHGPAEAAVGVALRIAWRTMVLAGADADTVLRGMDEVLRAERDAPATFATVCDVTICPTCRLATVRLHGHPPPLAVVPEVNLVQGGVPSPPLGIVEHEPATPLPLALPARWALLLSTDGLYEIRADQDRLGLERLVDIAHRIPGWAEAPEEALAALLEQVSDGGRIAFDDDVALLWLGSA